MALYQLVYTSVRICSDEDIQNILISCQKNNPGHEITGLLMHTDHRFIQVMEGEKEQVEKLFDIVQQDSRHTEVSLRFFGKVAEREFPDWHMGYKDVDTKTLKLNTSVNQEDIDKYERILNNEDIFSLNDGMRILSLFAKVVM